MLMHRQRMSKTATVRVIGRDMDEKMLHIREENCVWTLDEEETAEQQALKAIPDYLWKVADYIDSVGKWQGTATELLVAANIFDVKPNQFTRKMQPIQREVDRKNTDYIIFGVPERYRIGGGQDIVGRKLVVRTTSAGDIPFF